MERGQYPTHPKEHIANIEQIVYIAAFAIAGNQNPNRNTEPPRGPANRGQRCRQSVVSLSNPGHKEHDQ
jgi:hypothetical protein